MFASPVKAITPEEEYKKNPNIRPDDIKKLREWMQTQPHLPTDKITDLELILSYHCCDASAEVAKQVLDLNYTLRTLFTLLYKDRHFCRRVEFCTDNVLITPLPIKSPEGYSAMYCRLLDSDPKNFSIQDAARTFLMIYDLWQQAEGSWPGFHIIIDMDTSKLGHITRLEPMVLRQVLMFLQEAMFVKLKGLHFANAPYFMDKLMMLLKPFLKKELMSMIFIHEVSSETLFKHFPKTAFPKELGGDGPDYRTLAEEIRQWLQKNQDFFDMEGKRRVDESLRPGGKATTVEDLFGIQGSFKKLDID